MYNILLGESRMERGFEASKLGKFSARIGSLSAKAPPQSGILSYMSNFCNSLTQTSLRSFGIFLFLLGFTPTILSFVLGDGIPMLFAMAAGASLPLMLINRSLAQLYEGSFVLQKALGFFFVTSDMLKPAQKQHHTPLFTALGMILGFTAHFAGPGAMIMLAGGLIGGILILHRVEVGIFTAALFMPILPTMLILGLLAITTLSFALKLFITGGATLKITHVDIFVMLFAALVVFGLFISHNRANSAPMVGVYLLFIAFYFVVKNTLNTREKIFATAAIIATSGLAVAAFGIWQYLTGNFVMTAAWLDADFFGHVNRIYSTLENPNVLGGYLIFIVILAFAMIYYYKDALHKLVALGIFGTAGLCMVLTHSRGAWLGLILAAGLFALMRDRRLVVIGVLGLIAAPFIIPPEIMYRFLSIGDLADTSTSYRVSIWLGAVDMLRVFWPVGIGQGVENFNFVYNLYAFNAVFTQHSHNLYLQVMIYWGIVGIVLFLIIMGGFFKGLFRAVSRGDMLIKTLAAGLAAGMAGYLLKGFTDNVWYNLRILAFFWLIMALAAAIIPLVRKEKANDKKEI